MYSSEGYGTSSLGGMVSQPHWHAAAALVAMSSMAMNKLTVICFFVVCYSHAAW